MSKTKQLTDFDGREVVGTTIALTNAGDGLSKAVATEPLELHHGEKCYVVFETDVKKVRFDQSKDDPTKLIRVHTLKAGVATIVDFDLVAKVLEAQQAKNDKAAGKAAIPFGKDVSKPGDWETPERTPGGEPAPIGPLAEKALEKAAKNGAAKRTAKPKGDVPT